ncbi:helix-turn-helix domain-containing protein [Streptomyces sp. NPDC001546]|uniref:helix-turn-helix domain-containing protein n=1 Tax=Streptomyces sp. NPDC001546 TaxID=3364585 RepID=UPI0036A13CFC
MVSFGAVGAVGAGGDGDETARLGLVVGHLLRRERLTQGRTLKDVSEAAGISMPYLSEVERGRKEASSEVLAAAAQALGLDLADLLLLAGDELARRARRRAARGRTSPTAQYDSFCLAA